MQIYKAYFMNEINNLAIEKFQPKVEDLNILIALTSQVRITDFSDKEQAAEVKKNRIMLKEARIKIQKAGKAAREEALAFQKAVVAHEKFLIAIIDPEETRLKILEEEVEKMRIRGERTALLPERKRRLSEIDPDGTHDDEVLLGMDATEFQSYINQKIYLKNQKKQEELDAKENELKEKEQAIQREKEGQEREERARQQERERIEHEAKEKAAREARESERKRIDEENKQKALENQEAYKAFMAKHGLLETTKEELAKVYIMNDNTDPAHPKVKLYKLVDVLELKV